jgi:hypothetical protein
MAYEVGSMDSDRRAEVFAEPHYQEPRPRSRGVVTAAVALLVMGCFAGGLWFAYNQGLRHGSNNGASADVPLIRADERPTKVKPEKSGGMEIPDRDKLIYTQKRAAVEHLLPPPEKPMPRPTAPPIPTAQPDAAPAAATSAAAQPAQLQQSAIRPGPKPPSTPAEGAKPTAAPASPANSGGARLQLGSVHSEDAARHEWDRIKRMNTDLLATVSAAPIRADLGDKGVFYRIQTTPVGDAERVCGELKRRNIGCVVVR